MLKLGSNLDKYIDKHILLLPSEFSEDSIQLHDDLRRAHDATLWLLLLLKSPS